MAIPVIYKGDDTDFNGGSPIAVNIETAFNLDGCKAVVTFLGCVREFMGLSGRSARLDVAFSADETSKMPLGTHRATLRLYDSAGRSRTALDDIRLRVTDSVAEAYGASDGQEIDVTVESERDPAKLMEGQTLKTNTPNSMRQAIKKIAQALGATVSCAVLSVLPVLGASVQTAQLGEFDLDQNPSVVTNVTFEGLLTEHQDISGKADKTNTYTKAETDAKIVELAPAPGDYANVSNRAMRAIQAHQSLEPATNYVNETLSGFASTGMVAKAATASYADTSHSADNAKDAEVAQALFVDEFRSPQTITANELITESTNAAAWMLGQFAATGSVASAGTANYLREGGTNFSVTAFFEALSEAMNAAAARALSVGTPTRWMDATGCVWEVIHTWSGNNVPLLLPDGVNSWNSGDDDGWLSYSGGMWSAGFEILADVFTSTEPEDALSLTLQGEYSTVTLNRSISTALVGRVALTNDIVATEEDPTVPAWAKEPSKPTYSASEVGAYPATAGAEVAGVVSSWEAYWGGSNVTFEVTNYYNATSGELPRLRIREFRNGTWTNVWDEADKFQVCEAGILRAVSATNDALKVELATNFAPIAWGTVSDKGNPNPVANSTYMASPETYFGGGTEFQRIAVGSGSICVLVDRGALAKTAGEPGTFRFQDLGGTNYFGFSKSESYTIGCRTDGISVDAGMVTLKYDVIMSGTDVPIVYYKQTLADPAWVQLNETDGTETAGAPYSVTWSQSGGSYFAHINCGSEPSGFFTAETAVAGDVVFETNMRLGAYGGIACTNTAAGKMGVVRPSFNGSTVTWSWSEK